MDYMCVSSLAQTIDQMLNDPQHSLSLDEKQKLNSIHKHAVFLQRFLEKSPQEAHSFTGRLHEASDKAEDMIEYFMWEQMQFCLEKEKGGVSTKQSLHFDFEELEKVAMDFDSIARETMDIENSFGHKDVQPSDFSATTSLSSKSRAVPIGKNGIVGLDDDLLALKNRLCGESSKLQFIPIVGMGGIGKTTLARNVYDDPLIMQYFDIRVWVTVSQDYSTQAIFSRLKVSLKVESELDVYKSLKGRRYLIVMDDIWNTKPWDDVRRIFPDDNQGSRIILTTRQFDVASYVNSSRLPHEMRLMNDDQSWNLLTQKLFIDEECPDELEIIGKQIARSCRGLPLAIAVIAGVLSTVSKAPTSWQDIARNVNKAVTANDGQFADIILSLSYNHLPHHLRLCFKYTSMFPEDYEIRVSKLIKLWVAEGYLRPSGFKSLEEDAEECLNDLVRRSLVIVVNRKANGRIKTCCVHDLLRDMSIKETFAGDAVGESLETGRWIVLESSEDLEFAASTCGSTIRTMRCLRYVHDPSSDSFGHFRLLRVLEVVSLQDFRQVFSFPDQIFQLYHLKYLAFPFYGEIPAAISSLQNLQILVLHLIKSLYPDLCLPSEIWKMPKLRHLVFDQSYSLPSPVRTNLALENLQTLSEIHDFKCTMEILEMIPNVKKLGIRYLDNQHFGDSHLENLVHLHQLEKLKITVESGCSSQQGLNPVFPKTLKRLTMSGLGLSWNDMTLVGSLPNLEVLKLRDDAVLGDQWETTEGEFPQLKVLRIGKSQLKHWITESSHFPSLKCLQLCWCPYLNEIPEGIGEIPTLEKIQVDKGNESLVESARRIQEEQKSLGNDSLQLRVLENTVHVYFISVD